MKKNDRIKVSYGRTINMGNYESMRFEAGIETDVLEEEDLITEMQLNIEKCQKIVKQYIREKKKEKK